MDTRTLGPFEVSVVGLGCNNFGGRVDSKATGAVVNAALDAGITLYDTADIYSEGKSEEYLGKALGSRRDEVVVASKFGMEMPDGSGGSPAWVRQAADASLRRLGTDRIDLYQMHEPDDEVPLAETLGALRELVTAGKVIAVGCSNASVDEIRQGLGTSDGEDLPQWVSVQNEYSLLQRQPESDGVLAECELQGLGFLPFFPLASGVLTGKYRDASSPPDGTRLAGLSPERAGRFLSDSTVTQALKLEALAASHGHTLLELAFGYLLSNPAVASVIAGATRVEQIAANAAAASWVLSSDEAAKARDLTA